MVVKFNLFTSQLLQSNSNWISESCIAKLEQCVLLPLEGPRLKDHTANHVLAGHRGISGSGEWASGFMDSFLGL